MLHGIQSGCGAFRESPASNLSTPPLTWKTALGCSDRCTSTHKRPTGTAANLSRVPPPRSLPSPGRSLNSYLVCPWVTQGDSSLAFPLQDFNFFTPKCLMRAGNIFLIVDVRWSRDKRCTTLRRAPQVAATLVPYCTLIRWCGPIRRGTCGQLHR